MIKFVKSFPLSDPIPMEGIQRAVEIMERGALYRYDFSQEFVSCQDAEAAGHQNDLPAAEVAMLEQEFGRYVNRKYVIAVNSCGSAIFLALRALGVGHADKVLSNAFTFTAVPSSVVHVGAVPIYVECTSGYVIDLDDLQRNLRRHPDAKCLVLSHMRGHIADLPVVTSICEQAGIPMIEDCAHALGAKWDGKPVGNYGQIACFSTQSYKVLNSGEGGLIATSDERIAAYCILAAGSYEKLYKKHLARPYNDDLFESLKPHVPNFSLRMSNLTAAVLRPQLKSLDDKVRQGRAKYQQLAEILGSAQNIYIPSSPKRLERAPDSLQFTLPGLTAQQLDTFIQKTAERGVVLQVFGRSDNCRYYKNWRYSFAEQPALDHTDGIIRSTCDLRLPASFDRHDIDVIGYIIKDVLDQVVSQQSSHDHSKTNGALGTER